MALGTSAFWMGWKSAVSAGWESRRDKSTHCRITDCSVHHTGACGVKIEGSDTLIARNHIHDAGVYYPRRSRIDAKRARSRHPPQ